MALINILPTRNGRGLEQLFAGFVFLEKEKVEINLFPSVVQIVFIEISNSKTISVSCLNDCVITQCQALVHVGY